MKRISALLVLPALFCVTLWSPHDAGATPLFAVQAAESCDSCHVMPDRSDPKWVESNFKLSQRKCGLQCTSCHLNPSGGMLRSDAGFSFGTKRLPMDPVISDELQRAIQVVRGNRLLTLGGDLRFLDIITNQENKQSPFFTPMQADVYFGSRLHKYVALLGQFGMERNGNAAVREAFGLVDNLPYNSYFKFGKFIPSYGHRLDDHTAFIRKYLFFDHSTPEPYVAGVEIGAAPLVGFARASYFNEDALQLYQTKRTLHGYAATAGWHGQWLELGASYLNLQDYENTPLAAADRTAFGVFGAVRLARLSWMFEFDSRKDEVAATKGGTVDVDSLVTFNELNYRVMKGFNIKVRHETYDPNRDLDDDQSTRYLGGVDLWPYPFTELNFQYRYHDTPRENYGQIAVILHLWF